uniref:Uncharacterized protein n=1 Tax=Bracon brevicornis TaxID=1563983 RepID=A0A6V7L4D9_9HYME
MHRRAIGRKSPSEVGLFTLFSAMIRDRFHKLGNVAEDNEELNNTTRRGRMVGRASFTNEAGMPSTPRALVEK